MYRSLIHYRRINLAVMASAAVVTAVLTGALLVGDSLRGSLRDLAVERLGQVEQALVADRFFRAGLADQGGAVPMILVPGSAAHGATGARASGVQVHGISPSFAALFPASGGDLVEPLGRTDTDFPPLVINAAVQRELDARVGDDVLVSVRAPSAINRAFVLGSRESSKLSTTIRFTVAGILPDRGVGRFGLQPHQLLPRNAFAPLPQLQRGLDRAGRINALLLDREATSGALRKHLGIEDLGLRLATEGGVATLTSDEFVLRPAHVEAATAAAGELGRLHQPVLTYLANDITVGTRSIPYSIVAALDPVESLGSLVLDDGSVPVLEADEILLNAWAAADLGAEVGDAVELSYYAVGPRESLTTRSVIFRMRGIVPTEGLAVDPSLTPAFPGMHEAADMAAWDPPLPVDLSRIRPRDEAYWDRYGAAPKAFVSHAAGVELWSTRFGSATSVRVADPDGSAAAVIHRRLRELPGTGMESLPVRDRALAAARGATDFGPLFIGFSLFLIAAAALLTAQLFRLGVQQRIGEVGVLLALGHPLAAVRRRLVREGLMLAGTGGLVGTIGGLLYAAAMLRGLSTWWLAAVGTPFLSLHVEPATVLTGYILSLLLVALVVRSTVKRAAGRPLQRLFGGVASSQMQRSGSGAGSVVAAGAALLGILTMSLALWHPASAVGLFFASGGCWLVAGLAAYSAWLRRGSQWRLTGSVVMGLHNSSRHPGRNMLSAGLVACACFVIVAVGAHRRLETAADGWRPPTSGAGGFALVADADIPLHGDLNSRQVRFDLGFTEEEEEVLAAAKIFQMPVLPGEDVSCLNLYQPQRPRLLGVPDRFVERGGFTFQQHENPMAAVDSPWKLLQQPLEAGVIPAVGDYNSVRWILHLQLGDELQLEDDHGRPVRLRLVALLQNSLFQSELLISAADMARHFPHVAGDSYFLIDTGTASPAAVATSLERTLGRFGVDVTTTVAVLEGFRAIENTYLSTFQTLGGLGLLLGTIGLGFILLRNVAERTGELATLRACGFPPLALALMLLAENGAVLVVGMGIGTGAALVAVAPHALAHPQALPWWPLGETLLAVLAVGMVATAAAAAWALRQPLIPALRTA